MDNFKLRIFALHFCLISLLPVNYGKVEDSTVQTFIVEKAPVSVVEVAEFVLAAEKFLGKGVGAGIIDSLMWDQLYPGWRKNWILYEQPVIGWKMAEINKYIDMKNNVLTHVKNEGEREEISLTET